MAASPRPPTSGACSENPMSQTASVKSPEDWGNWYLAPNLKLKHKTNPRFIINIDELNSTADILKEVFISLHISYSHSSLDAPTPTPMTAYDAVYMMYAIKEILKFNGVSIQTNAHFDGYKCARNYYKCVVNKRNVPNFLRLSIFERDKFKCVYCGLSAKDGAVLNVDHILPVSKGGSNDSSNLQTLCRACNSGKADRIMPDDAPAPCVQRT